VDSVPSVSIRMTCHPKDLASYRTRFILRICAQTRRFSSPERRHNHALFHAERTGYWLDVTACDRVVEAYGAEIAKALQSGQFSGDGAEALRRWTALTASEAEYRMTMMAEARKTAPVVDPSCWWVVLELHPDAPRAK
jgi:hypothetical protein